MVDLDYIYTSKLPNENANSVHVLHFSEALSKKFSFRLFAEITTEPKDIFSKYNIKDKFHIEKININSKYLFILSLIFKRKLKDNIYTRDFFCALLISLFKKKVIWESHVFQDNLRYRFFYNLASKLDLFHKIVFITYALESKFRNYFQKEKKIVLPDGCREQSNIKVHKQKSILNIGYVGSFHEGKGVDTVIKVAEKVKQHNFIIIGGTKKQIKLAKEYSPENVDFKGYLDQKKLTDMYYQLDIALLPNKPSVKLFSKGLEIGDVTSPMKLFEYFAFGLPIISSDLPVLREILNGKNSILVPFGNIKNWAEAIEKLEDYKFRQLISNSGLNDFNKKYSWKIRSKKIFELM